MAVNVRMEVTNDYSEALNILETGGNGISPDAVGGNVLRPLPFPFGANGSLAPAGTLELGIRERDLVNRQQAQQPSMPADEWQDLVQKGWVSLSFTRVATGGSDVESDLIDTF